MNNLIDRKVGEFFIKRCKYCSTRTYNTVIELPSGIKGHQCAKCGKVNAKIKP
jgi:hypothetical protein